MGSGFLVSWKMIFDETGNAPRGAPCVGRELCRRSDLPQAEKLAGELLFYMYGEKEDVTI